MVNKSKWAFGVDMLQNSSLKITGKVHCKIQQYFKVRYYKSTDFSKIRENDKVSVESSTRNKGTLAIIMEVLDIFAKKNDINIY